MGRRDAMSRMVVVTLPEDQVNQLEFLAKEESNRIGKEVTMTDLAERAVRQQIKRMKKIRACIDRARQKKGGMPTESRENLSM
jgi:ribosomal protein S13